MIKIINSDRFYRDYKINSNLKYDINFRHLDKVIDVLEHAKTTMVKPVAAHYGIYINSEFDLTTLMARVKRVLKDVPMLFAYSVEKSKSLHIHLMLILDTKGYSNLDALFFDIVQPAISNLKNVNRDGCVINLRKNADSYYHDLTNVEQFNDAVERYSYFSKTSQKAYVPFKKAFNTSQLKPSKYYDFCESLNIAVKKTHRTEKLKLDHIGVPMSFQVGVKKQKEKGNDIKLCFSFINKQTQQPIGIYGLSYASIISESDHDFLITLDELYINKEHVDADWDEVLYFHLSYEVNKVLTKIKNNLRDEQKLEIHAVVPESPELEELLSLAVHEVCADLSLTDCLST